MARYYGCPAWNAPTDAPTPGRNMFGMAAGNPRSSVRQAARIRSHGNRRGAAAIGVDDKFASVPVEDLSTRVDRPWDALRRHRDLRGNVALHLDPAGQME